MADKVIEYTQTFMAFGNKIVSKITTISKNLKIQQVNQCIMVDFKYDVHSCNWLNNIVIWK